MSSRIEDILESIINSEEYQEEPLSRIEVLLLQLKEVIESGGGGSSDAVKYTAQTLTDAQKTQARTNIGAVQSDWNAYNSGNPDFIKNKPPVKVGQGTGGNLLGGTGMNNMNEATKQNSIAYGYAVSAKGNYSAAFGYFSQALHDYEIAYGKFNQSNADTAFSIGDGTSNSDKHNLMELKTDGTLLLNGNAVKTEGGDDDNKLRLGQIVHTGNAVGGTVYGFAKESVSTALSSIQFVLSYSDSTSNNEIFGDFVVGKDNYACIIQPIKGRTEGMTLTGAWVRVENCYKMFYNINHGTQIFTSCDLSMLDTSEVKDMTQMFAGCEKLKTLDISSFDMSNVIEYTDMFKNDTALTTLKTPKINPHNDIPLPRMLYSQDGTEYKTLPVTTGTSIELRKSWT